MTYAPGKIGSKELLVSNNVCFLQGEAIKIYPFEGNEAICIEFKLTMNDQNAFTTNVRRSVSTIYVEHLQTWVNARSAINVDIEIGSDESHTYYFSYMSLVSGHEKRYAINLSYSILKAAKI